MNLLVVSSFNYVKNYVTSISIGNVKLLVNSNGPVKNYPCTHIFMREQPFGEESSLA